MKAEIIRTLAEVRARLGFFLAAESSQLRQRTDASGDFCLHVEKTLNPIQLEVDELADRLRSALSIAKDIASVAVNEEPSNVDRAGDKVPSLVVANDEVLVFFQHTTRFAS